MSDQKIYFWIAASVAAVAAVNPNGIKIFLANGLSTFFIKDKPVFSNGPKSLPKNLILCTWVVDSYILAEEPFAKLYKDSKLVC